MAENGTGEFIHGNAENVYGYLPGAVDLPPILLSAHMDSVDPAMGKHRLHPDGTITSDGTTVLGADPICPAWRPYLEAVRSVEE
ncbi:MAG: hypothetical protein V8S71_11255 [Oscillospiraceae bacterium]